MRNIKAIIQYDGKDYCGFQRQSKQGSPSIQETLEELLSQAFHEKITVYSAGRTDSGVHALGQVINFYTKSNIPLEKIVPVLNHRLPEDIVFTKVEEVPLEFHARKCALGKYYQYHIYNGQQPTAIGRRYYHWVAQTLDEELLRRGAKLLEGTHDFRSFCAKGTSVKTFVRTLYYIRVERQNDWWTLHFYGNGFLRHMVRIITGTLIDVALKRRSLESISIALDGKDRKLAGKTAPPQGLVLKSVYYP